MTLVQNLCARSKCASPTYKNRTVDMDMPKYVDNALQRFEHELEKAEHSPHHWIAPHYGKATQLTSPPDKSAPLSPADLKLVQQIVGVFLYYARALDNTMLVTLNAIAAAQSKGTQATLQACRRLLDYAATHSDARIRYHASDMVYKLDSDASYTSVSPKQNPEPEATTSSARTRPNSNRAKAHQ